MSDVRSWDPHAPRAAWGDFETEQVEFMVGQAEGAKAPHLFRTTASPGQAFTTANEPAPAPPPLAGHGIASQLEHLTHFQRPARPRQTGNQKE